MRRYRHAVVAVTALTLTACGSGGGSGTGDAPAASGTASKTPTATPSPTGLPPIAEAAKTCGVTNNVSDGGKTATFDTEGKDDTAADSDDMADVACVLSAIKIPDYVTSHVDSTRALDGTQEDTWGTFTARWTYHPDDGLRITVFEKQ